MIEPLDPEMRALLERASEGAPPSAAVRARLRSRVGATVGGSGAGGAALVKLLGAVGVTGAVATVWLATRAPAAAEPPAAISLPSVELADPGPQRIAASARLEAPPVDEAPVRVVETAPAVAAPVETAPVESAPVETVPVAEPPRAQPAPDTLARERELIEAARQALARRTPDRARAQLAIHEAEFPGGQLVEEREALAVQALVLAKDQPAAEARARAFRSRFPNSIFRDLVDEVAPDLEVR